MNYTVTESYRCAIGSSVLIPEHEWYGRNDLRTTVLYRDLSYGAYTKRHRSKQYLERDRELAELDHIVSIMLAMEGGRLHTPELISWDDEYGIVTYGVRGVPLTSMGDLSSLAGAMKFIKSFLEIAGQLERLGILDQIEISPETIMVQFRKGGRGEPLEVISDWILTDLEKKPHAAERTHEFVEQMKILRGA